MTDKEILMGVIRDKGHCPPDDVRCEDCPLVKKCERNTLEYPDEHALTYKQAIAMYADRFGAEDVFEELL